MGLTFLVHAVCSADPLLIIYIYRLILAAIHLNESNDNNTVTTGNSCVYVIYAICDAGF